MSAYICDNPHLTALATAAVICKFPVRAELSDAQAQYEASPYGQTEYAARVVATELYAENSLSLAARYPRDWREMVGDGFDFCKKTAQSLGLHGPISPYTEKELPVVALFKAIDCYQYQACEHEAWKESRAKEITDDLRRYLTKLVKGYEEAAWGWDAKASALGNATRVV